MGVRLDRKAKDPQSDFVAQTPEEQTCGDATYRELLPVLQNLQRKLLQAWVREDLARRGNICRCIRAAHAGPRRGRNSRANGLHVFERCDLALRRGALRLLHSRAPSNGRGPDGRTALRMIGVGIQLP